MSYTTTISPGAASPEGHQDKCRVASKTFLPIRVCCKRVTDSGIRLNKYYAALRRPAALNRLGRSGCLACVECRVSPGERIVLPAQAQSQLARKVLICALPAVIDDCPVNSHRFAGGFVFVAGSQWKIMTRAPMCYPDGKFTVFLRRLCFGILPMDEPMFPILRITRNRGRRDERP